LNYKYIPNINYQLYIKLLCKKHYFISLNQLNSIYSTLKYFLKRNVKINTGITPYIPLTRKPIESRMGKGKGNKIRTFIAPIKPGKLLYNINGNEYYLKSKCTLLKLKKKKYLFQQFFIFNIQI